MFRTFHSECNFIVKWNDKLRDQRAHVIKVPRICLIFKLLDHEEDIFVHLSDVLLYGRYDNVTDEPFLLSIVESIEFREAYYRSNCLRFSSKRCHTSIFHPVVAYSILHSKYVPHSWLDMHVNVFYYPFLFHLLVYMDFRVRDLIGVSSLEPEI